MWNRKRHSSDKLLVQPRVLPHIPGMRTGNGFRAGVLVVLASALGIGIWAWLRPREPMYQGHPAGYWIENVAAFAETNALTAIQQLGTNALPAAIRKMERDDSKWRARYAGLWRKSPTLLRRLLPEPNRRRLVGSLNVFILVGHDALPDTIEALKHKDPVIRAEAASALAYFTLSADEVRRALPPLIKALDDPDPSVRLDAATAIGNMGPAAADAVPALTSALRDRAVGYRTLGSGAVKLPILSVGSDVRNAAITALRKIGPPAHTSMPALKRLVEGGDPFTSGQAALAIWRIDHDADSSLPTLVKVLSEPSAARQFPDLLKALGEMGPQAVSAIPLLTRLIETHDQSAPTALEAMRMIDPVAAERLVTTKGPVLPTDSSFPIQSWMGLDKPPGH